MACIDCNCCTWNVIEWLQHLRSNEDVFNQYLCGLFRLNFSLLNVFANLQWFAAFSVQFQESKKYLRSVEWLVRMHIYSECIWIYVAGIESSGIWPFDLNFIHNINTRHIWYEWLRCNENSYSSSISHIHENEPDAWIKRCAVFRTEFHLSCSQTIPLPSLSLSSALHTITDIVPSAICGRKIKRFLSSL